MRTRFLVPAAIMFLASATCFAQWANVRETRVAVLDVLSRVKDEAIDTATLTEMLQVALVDKNAFKVVERSLIEKILKEQELQVSGMTDAQIARIGALAGANKILALSISKMGDTYIFIAKSIDTTTGIVDLSDQVTSPKVAGFIDLFPVLADRIVRKAKGESVSVLRGSSASEAMPSAASAPSIPRNGLVSEWLFDGAVRDSVMRRLGRVVDVALGKDRFGKDSSAGYFNGATSFVDAGAVFKTPIGTWSISLWVYTEEIYRAPLSQYGGLARTPLVSNFNRWVPEAQTGYLLGHLNWSDGNAQLDLIVCDGRSIQGSWVDQLPFSAYDAKYARKWMHVCVVAEDGQLSIYTDGGIAGRQSTAKIMVPDNGSPTWIGRTEANGSRFFKGALDDIRFYDRALEEDEILALYDETR